MVVAGAAIATAGSAALAWYRSRPTGPADDALDNLTKDELYQRAQAAEIAGRSGMSKDELIRALRNAS